MRRILQRLPVRHGRRSIRLTVGAGAIAIGAIVAAVAPAARLELPVAGESAFCNGVPAAAVGGVLQLTAGCVLNLQIGWLPGLKGATVESSTDGGATWRTVSLPQTFPVVSVGQASGLAFGVCDAGLPSGIYLLRANGFHAPNGEGTVASASFPESVSLTCA